MFVDIFQEIKMKYDFSFIKGIFIVIVSNGGGVDKVGIKEYFVILKIGIKEVNFVLQLQEEIGCCRLGDKVMLIFFNFKGEQEIVDVVFCLFEGEIILKMKEEISKNFVLGVIFFLFFFQELKELNFDVGVKIKIFDSGKLKIEGLEEGMVIYKVNYEKVMIFEVLVSKFNFIYGDLFLVVVVENGQKYYVGFVF